MQNSTFPSLQGEKVAVLVANGFHERDLTEAQRALQESGAHIRVISMDGGLVTSWNGSSWGLNFPADSMLNEALAVDYSMLLIPGGRRSADKLKLTAHTRRFINGFLNAGKPLALRGEAVELLGHIDVLAGMNVTADVEYKEEAARMGAHVSEDAICVEGHLMTAQSGEDANFVGALVAHFGADSEMKQAA